MLADGDVHFSRFRTNEGMDAKAKPMNLEERLRNSIKRWTEKAKVFEQRSFTVEGPMDDVLIAKAGELRLCAMEMDELLEQAQLIEKH